jgi:hypothetical protein
VRLLIEELVVPIMGAFVDHCGGYALKKILASAYEDLLGVTMISGTLLSVHTTYPL